ncbi:MAG TPA: M23 family metallopeptidase [Gallionella sp.]|nr:M23 family metallopeptidase [Gallionella sp.]
MNNIPVSGYQAKPSRAMPGPKRILWLQLALVMLVAIVLQATQAWQVPSRGDGKLDALLSIPQHGELQKTPYLFPFQLAAMTLQLVWAPERELCPAVPGACLVKLSQQNRDEFRFESPSAPNTPLIAALVKEMAAVSLGRHFDQLAQLVNTRSDKRVAIEDVQLQNRLGHELLPPTSPVEAYWPSNNFGWRLDPFTGIRSIHEGIDYMAPEGTPIRALADGVVVYSENHYQYGNMIEINHGNNIVTRYAHASRLLVKVGQVVWRGEKIAEVGSTGRATGSHLHFEVRYKGIAQNPVRFLQNAAS